MSIEQRIKVWHQGTTAYTYISANATSDYFLFNTDCRAPFGDHAITAAAAATDCFTIAGDYHHRFIKGMKFVITGSTAGADDGVWTVNYSSYTSSTVVYVDEDVTGAAGDGTLHYCRQWDIAAVNTATETIYVTGDLTSVLYATKVFYVDGSTANDGAWTVSAITYSGGVSRIVVTGNITSAVADGQIVVPGGVVFMTYGDSSNKGTFRVDYTQAAGTGTYTFVYTRSAVATIAPPGYTAYLMDYIDLTQFAHWSPTYNIPAQKITDRLGIVHRVAPVGTTTKKRHCYAGTLTIHGLDTDLCSAMGLRVPEFVEVYCMDADDALTIFDEFHSIDQDGKAYEEKRAYVVHLDEIPEWLFGAQSVNGDDWPETISFPCIVDQHGTFATYTTFNSTSYVARP